MIEKEVTFVIKKEKSKELFDILQNDERYVRKNITQFYSEQENFRLRSQKTDKNKIFVFNKKIKSINNPGTSYEFEEEIPEDQFYDMLQHCNTSLSKIRFSRNIEDLHYDIDFYHLDDGEHFYYFTIEVEYSGDYIPSSVIKELRGFIHDKDNTITPSNHSISKMDVSQKLSIYSSCLQDA